VVGVQPDGLVRGHAEEPRVEGVDPFEEATRGHGATGVRRAATDGQLVDRVPSVLEHIPEFREVRRTG
jgi:hypothetical protein